MSLRGRRPKQSPDRKRKDFSHPKRQRLHRLVYLAGILVVVHFVWLVKSDGREPLVYGAITALLLVARIRGVRKTMSPLRSQLKSLPQITNAHAKS